MVIAIDIGKEQSVVYYGEGYCVFPLFWITNDRHKLAFHFISCSEFLYKINKNFSHEYTFIVVAEL